MCQVCVGLFVQIYFVRMVPEKCLISIITPWISTPLLILNIIPKSLYILGIYSSFSHRISLQHPTKSSLTYWNAVQLNEYANKVCLYTNVTCHSAFVQSWLFLLKILRLSVSWYKILFSIFELAFFLDL